MKSLLVFGCTLALVTFADVAMAKSAKEVEEIARSTTVEIKLQKRGEVGSGVIIDRGASPKGDLYTVATNRHVVCGTGNATCTKVPPDETFNLGLADGQRVTVKSAAIKVLGKDLDLAIIQFRSSRKHAVAQIEASSLKFNETVFTAGFPFDSPGFTFGKGLTHAVVNKRISGDRGGYSIIYDARTLPGMSGGGVFNSNGQLVAIHGQGDRYAQGTQLVNKYRIGTKTGFNRGIPVRWLVQSLGEMGIKIGGQRVTLPPVNTKATADEYFIMAFNRLANPGQDADGSARQAVKEFSQAIQLNPKYGIAYFMRATTYKLLRDYDLALQDFNQAIAVDPQDPDNYLVRARLRYDNLFDRKGALADYDRAIALNPKYLLAYNERGQLRYFSNDDAGALADYNQAIAINPKNSTGYSNRASVKQRLGDKKGALADYSQAIALSPKWAAAYFNRAGLKVGMKDKAGAIADYRQAARLFREQGDENTAKLTVQILETMGAKE
jgi:tetratricopeptide (TPR) repeat protein